MRKFQFIFASLAVAFLLACTQPPKVGLKESWVDERDIMALKSAPINEWLQSVGRPSLVEIIGDTSIYYYNYRPTLYLAVAYTEGKPAELKPTPANSTEIWGSRKNLMQIKIVQNAVVSAIVVAGPDKKTYIRDLNGDLILDPKSGFDPDYSDEVKIRGNFEEFMKEYSTMNVKNPVDSIVPSTTAPALPQPAPASPETPSAAPPAPWMQNPTPAAE
jgi:hypothetical protein